MGRGKKKPKNEKRDVVVVAHQDPAAAGGLTSDIADQVLQRGDEIEKEEENLVTKARILRDQMMQTEAGRQKLATWSKEALATEEGDSGGITRRRFIAVPPLEENVTSQQVEAFLLHLQQAGADMSNSSTSGQTTTAAAAAPTPPLSHCVYVWCPCRYSTRRGKISLSLSHSLSLSLLSRG